MNGKEYILLEYAILSDGEALAGELCPACKGGSTGERTLSVSKREGLLLWTCHRASCQFKGAVRTASSAYHRTESQIPTAREVFGRQIAREGKALDNRVRQYLHEKYAITAKHIHQHEIGWAEQESRLIIPVKDFARNERGVVLRSISNQQPKTLSHTEQGAISWHVNHTAKGVIIVEDQLSAIRASDYLTAVALLGTHFNEERAAEIKASRLSPVYFALDYDAWNKTIAYCKEYRSYLNPIPVRLTKDIKDCTDEELAILFAELNG